MSRQNKVLPEEQQAKLIKMLNRRLADTIDLQLQSRQAFWNVKGPNFMTLRDLFNKVAEGVEEYASLIAERIVTLGGLRSMGTRFRVLLGTATSMLLQPLSPSSADMHATPASKRSN